MFHGRSLSRLNPEGKIIRKSNPKTIMLQIILLMTLFCMVASSSLAEALNVYHGDRDQKTIAITVDDCYDIDSVQEIWTLCEEYDIPCTFFVIGSALKYKDSEIWQQIAASSCEIGNHTWSHKRLTGLNAHNVKYQMLRTQQKLDELLGYHYAMQAMRPPYGDRDRYVVSAVSEIGYACVITWDVSQTNAVKARKIVQNGSVLLYHARKKDVACLRKLIPWLLEDGYHCVTVSELLGLDPVLKTEGIYNYKENRIILKAEQKTDEQKR